VQAFVNHCHKSCSVENANWDLVPNGNFENDPTNWPPQLLEQRGRFVRSTDKAVDGMFSLKTIPGDNGCGFAHITDEFPTIPGRGYVLSCFFYTQQMLHGNLYVDLAQTLDVRVKATPGKEGWQFKHTTFVAVGESVRIRVVCDGPMRSTYVGYVDCVALTPVETFSPSK